MGFLKTKIWVLSFLFIALGMYPVQKYLINQGKAKKETLKQEKIGMAGYLVNAPSRSFSLPSYLDEISGLSLSSEDSLLIAIQDEKGLLFFIDKTTGEVVQRVKFGGSDDYEGVEMVGDRIYISNNKGDLYSYQLPGDSISPQDEAEKQKTFLNSSDDIEGLGYFAASNSLLLACKNARKKGAKKRNIFSYDLTKQALDSAAFLTLHARVIADSLGREKSSPHFSPSALAVHPLTGNIYILSSPASSIIVMNASGNILYAATLDRGIHRQPEGIVFDRDGTLYISNEARGTVAKVHVFNP